jgi:hypothetical protein
LEIPVFKEKVFNNIAETFLSHRYRSAFDMWQAVIPNLRKILRSFGANVRGEYRRRKGELLRKIKSLDENVEINETEDDDWVKRYDLEEELIRVYNHKEVYWQSRGDVKWILEGDSNTTYFHSLANGRMRKCRIDYLDTENGRITEQQELMDHIYEFYKKLFGEEERGSVRLAADMWQDKGRLSLDQQADLIKPFFVGEVE